VMHEEELRRRSNAPARLLDNKEVQDMVETQYTDAKILLSKPTIDWKSPCCSRILRSTAFCSNAEAHLRSEFPSVEITPYGILSIVKGEGSML